MDERVVWTFGRRCPRCERVDGHHPWGLGDYIHLFCPGCGYPRRDYVTVKWTVHEPSRSIWRPWTWFEKRWATMTDEYREG